jgi:hypothetical protein
MNDIQARGHKKKEKGGYKNTGKVEYKERQGAVKKKRPRDIKRLVMSEKRKERR